MAKRRKDGIQLRHPPPRSPTAPRGSDSRWPREGGGSLEFSLLLSYYEVVWGKETSYNGKVGRKGERPTLNCYLPPKSITGNVEVKGSGDHTEGSGSWAGPRSPGEGSPPEARAPGSLLARPRRPPSPELQLVQALQQAAGAVGHGRGAAEAALVGLGADLRLGHELRGSAASAGSSGAGRTSPSPRAPLTRTAPPPPRPRGQTRAGAGGRSRRHRGVGGPCPGARRQPPDPGCTMAPAVSPSTHDSRQGQNRAAP